MLNYMMMPLKKYADFSGRASRSEFWYFNLFFMVVYMALIFLGVSILGESGVLLGVLFALAMFIPSLAVTIRRMHDVGKSGWYMLIPVYSLILALTAGDQGPNEYGADPHGGADEITDHLVG